MPSEETTFTHLVMTYWQNYEVGTTVSPFKIWSCNTVLRLPKTCNVLEATVLW